MASEVIKLNLIPKGEMPVFHASQFDTGRLITCELYRGEDAYSVPEGYTVELHCRKVDNNIVTMASTLINDNVVTFTSTEQLTACNGNNLCEVAILDEGYRIGTLNFWLEVEMDPLKGGINSTSEIHNLESQVEEITTEIIGDNYYNKTEVDDLLDAKADSDSVYTIGEVNTLLSGKANASDVYTKSQTDTLLNAKADSSDVYTKGQVDTALAAKANADDVYTKSQTDTLLSAKANSSDVYTKSQTDTLLSAKANSSDVYTKTQVDNIILDIMPVDTAGPASIASFDTALAADLVDCVTALDPSLTGYTAVNLTACGVNLININGTEFAEVQNPNVAIPFVDGMVIKGISRDGYVRPANVSYSVSGDKVTINISSSSYGVGFAFRAIPNTDYYVSCSNSFGSASVYYDKDGKWIGDSGAYVNGNNSFTTPNNCAWCVIILKPNSINVDTDFNEFLVNVGTTKATYHAYTGNTYTIAFGQTVYGGTLDVTTGVLTVEYDSSLQPITPYDVQLSPTAVRAIVGDNNVYSDTGDTTVQYKDTIQNYIDKKVST